MSLKEWKNQQNNMTKNEQNPIAGRGGKKIDEKASRNLATGFTIAGAASILLFGIAGGMICLAGCGLIYAICSSRLPLAAKIILSIVAGLASLTFLFMYVLLSAAAMAQ